MMSSTLEKLLEQQQIIDRQVHQITLNSTIDALKPVGLKITQSENDNIYQVWLLYPAKLTVITEGRGKTFYDKDSIIRNC